MKRIFTVGSAIIAAICIMPAVCFAADSVGFINASAVMLQHPKYAGVQKQLQSFTAQKEKEAEAAAEKVKDVKQKQQAVAKKAKEVADKEVALMQPLFKDIDTAVRASAKANGCVVVLNEAAVVAGGKDLTKDVIARIKK